MAKVYHLDSNTAMNYISFKLADIALVQEHWKAGLYKHVANVDSHDLDVVYELTNNIDRRWTDNPGVEPVAGHGQRSTSVGDLVEINGEFWVCASIGWTVIPL